MASAYGFISMAESPGYGLRGDAPDGDYAPPAPLGVLTFSGANGSAPPSPLYSLGGSWEQRDGKLRGIGTRPPSEVAYSWLIGADTGMSDGVLELTINANGEYGDEGGGMFRGIDPFNFLDAINLDGNLLIAGITNNIAGVISAGVPIPGYANNADVHLRIAFRGTRIVIEANGEIIHDVTNSTHITGTIHGVKSSSGIFQTYDNMLLPNAYSAAYPSYVLFGARHSMISHTFVGEGVWPPTTYTDALNWIPILASASGTTADVVSTLFGNVAGINNLWVPNDVAGHWATKNFTHVTAMAPNYAQNYGHGDTTPDNNPVLWGAELIEFIDRVEATGQTPQILLFIPAGYSRQVTGAYPVNDLNLTPAEVARWAEHTRTHTRDWYMTMVNIALDARPLARLRVIPFADLFCDLLEEPYMSTAVWTDFFGDASPHGKDTYYLLTALCMHRVIHGTNPVMAGFTLPVGADIIPEVADNLPAIVVFFEQRLDWLHNNTDYKVY